MKYIKYIKFFENLEYSKIETQDIFYNKIEEYGEVPFTKKEIDTLISMGNEDSYHRPPHKRAAPNRQQMGESVTLFPKSLNFYIVIFKCTDEWFMCAKISIISTTTGDFYKCDQWDGLMTFLKQHIN